MEPSASAHTWAGVKVLSNFVSITLSDIFFLLCNMVKK